MRISGGPTHLNSMSRSPSLRSRYPLAALRSHLESHSYLIPSPISRHERSQRGLRSRNSSRTAADAESRYCYESASRRRRLTHRAEYTPDTRSPDYQGPSAVLVPDVVELLSATRASPVPRSPLLSPYRRALRILGPLELQGCFIPLVPEARGRIRHCHVLGTRGNSHWTQVEAP